MSGHRTTRSQPRHAAPQHSHPVITTAVGTVVVLGAGTAALAAPAPYTAPPMGDTLPATPAVQAAPQTPGRPGRGPGLLPDPGRRHALLDCRRPRARLELGGPVGREPLRDR